jgi:hypothetical protein
MQGGLIAKILSKSIPKFKTGQYVYKKYASASHNVSKSWSNVSYRTYDSVKALRAQTGGMIINVPPANFKMEPHAYQSGGSVGSSKEDKKEIHIHISPQFMTGDRRAARQVAVEVKKQLDELNARWGT